MKTTPFLLVVFLLFFLISFSSLSAQSESKPDPLCGPKSLLVVCQKLGVKTNLDELKRLSDYKEEKGTTMAGLYNAVKAKGLQVAGMKMSLDKLSELKIPIIAYLWDNHCLVIDKFEGKNLRVIDPPQGPHWVSQKEFVNDYSGFSLLIFKDESFFPQIEIRGPDIRFEEYVYNFGVVEQGEKEKIEHIFKFQNSGNEDLIISQVRACCGSNATLLSEKNIPPQGKGEIKATVDVGGGRGEQDYSVYVYSNDSATSMVKLKIKGFVKTEPVMTRIIIFPQNIGFGDINKGTFTSRKIQIIMPEDEEISIIEAGSSSKYISAKIFPNKEGSYKGFEEDYEDFEMEVTVLPNVPIGKLEEKVTIYTNDEKTPQIEIPITGNVKGDIEFYPDMFFFGFVKEGETSTSKVALFTTSKKPLKIEKIENPLQSVVSIVITPKVEGKEYEITATLRNNASTGSLKGSITIHTNNPDQPKIQIPVYALVQE